MVDPKNLNKLQVIELREKLKDPKWPAHVKAEAQQIINMNSARHELEDIAFKEKLDKASEEGDMKTIIDSFDDCLNF